MYEDKELTDQEAEWLDDQIYWYGMDSIGPVNLEELKDYHCMQHRWKNCEGCLYYDSEDEVCKFDK